jgi:hypothetical protein
MAPIKLIAFLLPAVMILHSCSKDSVSATTTSNSPLQALVNGTSWVPDTISSSITYNAATKSKTLYCISTHEQKQVIFSVTLADATNTAGFTTGTYTVDETPKVAMQYNVQQRDDSGNYVYVQQGTVTPGSGTVVVSSVDSVKKVITGTFSLVARSNNPDGTITVNEVSAGAFNSMPYTSSSSIQ